MPADLLHRIAERRREALAERKPRFAGGLPPRPAEFGPARAGVLRSALRRPGPGVPLRFLCELKRRSPSRGLLREDFDVPALARAFRQGGASALSVLTEPDFFDGAPEHLTAARRASGLPCLLKDFVVDPWQIEEAASLGADAVLLIVALLPVAELEALQRTAWARGLDALVEVHTEAELDIALDLEANLIGINNRDLATFEVDPRVTLALRPRIPAGVTVVSESGIATADDVRALARAGVDAALVGEALLREADVEAGARELVRAAEDAARAAGAPPAAAPPSRP